jgi:Family of unknown function (DUF6228)
VIDDEAIEVVIGREVEGALAIGKADTSRGYAQIPIRIAAPDIAASGTIDLDDWSGGLARLPAFFDDLEKFWRGWKAAKEWHDDSGTFTMSATHDRKGMVTLHVVLETMPPNGPGSWQVAVDVGIEPGALAAISQRIRRLLEQPDLPA